MITEHELNIVELSPTKKDFYQIWNELLETAQKMSERWDPTSTNESDPGIVLLKVLTAIADKLNYTVDKNILEAFMPSATQEESMRKLCDMLGYSMKYFQSATTDVTIRYVGQEELTPEQKIIIPRFTYITNKDEDITYFTLEEISLTNILSSATVEAIEGQLVTCKTNDREVIKLAQIDDSNRYYLPESQVAENGIFIYNVKQVDDNGIAEDTQSEWKKVQNLNIQDIGTRVYKFGYDSKQGYPYIQFPDDIGELIEDGLKIKYTRTNGINGNIKVNTLNSLQNISDVKVFNLSNLSFEDDTTIINEDNFVVSNNASTKNGKNKESLDDAYNNYKKTIGTFDTLVTCRDYMNKIYQMTIGDSNGSKDTTPLVSNVIVSDIRDDINGAFTLCSFNEYGICYKNMAKQLNGEDRISHFDLLLYPFKNVVGLNTDTEYINSFKYDTTYLNDILQLLEENKTISHNITTPDKKDIVCLKNYLKLKARITTTYKVSTIEEDEILKIIYSKLYSNFNMRRLDFGDEIPYESILEVIENADPRIKNVSLDEPILYTSVCLADGKEIPLLSTDGDKYYLDIVVGNVISGRVPLFNYKEDFKPEYDESEYEINGTKPYSSVYPSAEDIEENKKIVALKAKFEPDLSDINDDTGLTLKENEVIQFRAQNFKTTKTYPAYINYFLQLDDSENQTGLTVAIPATMITAKDLLTNKFIDSNYSVFETNVGGVEVGWQAYYNYLAENNKLDKIRTKVEVEYGNIGKANVLLNYSRQMAIFDSNEKYILPGEAAARIKAPASPEPETTVYTYYYLQFNTTEHFVELNNFIKLLSWYGNELKGLFKQSRLDLTKPISKYVDANHYKYTLAKTFKNLAAPYAGYSEYFVQQCFAEQVPSNDATYEDLKDIQESNRHTTDGLGRDTTLSGISKDGIRLLGKDEYLLINYTNSTSNDDGTSTKSVVNLAYTAGTLIKPNFEISDSTIKHDAGINYDKKSGFEFTNYQIDNPEGMYTLGTSEQIEIIEPIIVYFGGENCIGEEIANIYWERNDEDSLVSPDDGYMHFIYDEEGGTAYTLKENEYIYYTDKNKNELAYYGYGTVVKVATDGQSGGHAKVDLVKSFEDKDKLKHSDVSENGLLAAIPWRQYTFTKDNYIELHEYQYITLTKDDTLLDIHLTGETDGTLKSEEWINCDDALYKYSDNESTTQLPKLLSNDSWQISSRLLLNMSPSIRQTLNEYDSITIIYDDDSESEEIKPAQITTYSDPTGGEEGTGAGDLENSIIPLSLKSNYICRSSSVITDVRVKKATSTSDEEYEYINDFKLKLVRQEDLKVIGNTAFSSALNLNDFGDGWTTIKPAENAPGEPRVTIHALVQDNTFGILSIYYISNKDSVENCAKITLSQGMATIFNNGTWWNGRQINDNYYLKPGLNVVQIWQSADITFYNDISSDNKSEDIILLGSLDLVDLINSSNPWLALDQEKYYNVLARINELDPEHLFYYNAVMDKSNMLEINTLKDIDDEDADTLDNPKMLYDYNNVYNKFTISEIDVAEMKKGIVIVKSSKK